MKDQYAHGARIKECAKKPTCKTGAESVSQKGGGVTRQEQGGANKGETLKIVLTIYVHGDRGGDTFPLSPYPLDPPMVTVNVSPQ